MPCIRVHFRGQFCPNFTRNFWSLINMCKESWQHFFTSPWIYGWLLQNLNCHCKTCTSQTHLIIHKITSPCNSSEKLWATSATHSCYIMCMGHKCTWIKGEKKKGETRQNRESEKDVVMALHTDSDEFKKDLKNTVLLAFQKWTDEWTDRCIGGLDRWLMESWMDGLKDTWM